MEILLKSNDHVYISWIKNILTAHGISFYTMDEEMSVMEGNITAIPIRILVEKSQIYIAKQIIEKERKELT